MTSSRHRSFTTIADKEPITFDIDGEEFTAVNSIPGGVLLDIAQTLNSTGDPDIQGVVDFFDAAICKDDQERFAEMIRRPDGPGIDVLVSITKFLVEEYTGFPTGSSPGSSPPPSPNGHGSPARKRSQASRSKSSQRTKR